MNELIKNYRKNDELRHSFNELAKATFGLDFEDWYQNGYWGENYIPYSIVKDGNVIANVSVNITDMNWKGSKKHFIQLGTVMTAESYRNQGLIRQIMEEIEKDYGQDVDGMYLFANDEVLTFYPKFGFVPCEEYEYYFTYENKGDVMPYSMEKVDMSDDTQAKQVYAVMENYFAEPDVLNENDGMYMSENISLYHFWMDSEYRDNIYYLPECNAYVVGAVDNGKLHLYQIIGKEKVELERVAKAFGDGFFEVVLGYTPVHKEGLSVRKHKEEDCTLFILGEDLKCMSEKQMMFPVLSHA